MFLGGIDNLINGLLDSNINYLVTVIRQNNINQILTDIVHIAFNGS